MDSREQDQARMIAIRAGILLKDSVIDLKIQELANYDENINIRKTALEVLKENTNSRNRGIERDQTN